MRKKRDGLTPAEWNVMEIVWRLRSCDARDVQAEAEREYSWAPSTVKTYLSLLVKKGYLTATRVGNSFLYRPKRTYLKSLLQAGDALLEKTLDEGAGPLITHLVKKSKLSASEIEELRLLLSKQTPRDED